VHHLAPSLRQSSERNRLKGVMLDTTWAIMQNYGTAIVVAVIFNTAVRLAFAFGPIESFELYDKFYNTFKSKYNIDLSHFKVESDQGSGLKNYCETHHIVHRFCLRHFLASLGDRLFSCYVEYLVKSVNQGEFEMLSVAFCKPLDEVINAGTDPNVRLIRARHEFAKAGLAINYSDGQVHSITVGNIERWAQVLILHKIVDQLSSTTNALESINGHLNHIVGRRNTFWSSLVRLAEQIEHGINRFTCSTSVRDNCHRGIRKSWVLSQSMGEIEMNSQIAFYHSCREICNCGQTVHLSSMYEIPIPCCHRFHLGAVRPRMHTSPQLHFLDRKSVV
jgi:hypothetical protein